jgi:hypothetical protein
MESWGFPGSIRSRVGDRWLTLLNEAHVWAGLHQAMTEFQSRTRTLYRVMLRYSVKQLEQMFMHLGFNEYYGVAS